MKIKFSYLRRIVLCLQTRQAKMESGKAFRDSVPDETGGPKKLESPTNLPKNLPESHWEIRTLYSQGKFCAGICGNFLDKFIPL
jgi:hypothetical protein